MLAGGSWVRAGTIHSVSQEAAVKWGRGGGSQMSLLKDRHPSPRPPYFFQHSHTLANSNCS